MPAVSTMEDEIEIPDYKFRRLEDVAKMRLLEIQPAPTESETLNCRIIHVPELVYKDRHSIIDQEKSFAKTAAVDSDKQRDGLSTCLTGLEADVMLTHEDFQAKRWTLGDEMRMLARQAAAERARYDIVMPSYEALSYRWSSGKPTRSIRIHENGSLYQILIHEDLFDALILLRFKSAYRNIWVDTLCVNQSDPVERSQQVARMHEVYSEASNVCVWLGQAGNGSTEAIRFLAGKDLGIHDFDDRCNDEQFVEQWASLLTLLKRDWFSRRWVIQEIFFARRATVHCGSETVGWEDLADAVSLLNDMDQPTKLLSHAARKSRLLRSSADLFAEISNLPALQIVRSINQTSSNSVNGNQRLATLEQLVARFAMFQSGEPRDYIYALLTLAKDSQRYAGLPDHIDGRPLTAANKKALQAVLDLLPSYHRRVFPVDYKLTVVEVYQQFLKYVLSYSDPALALDIICRPFAPSGLQQLPSWIPVVSELPFVLQSTLKKDQPRVRRERGDPFVSMPDVSPQYTAAGRRPFNKNKVRFRKRSDHYSMFVEGFVLDTVARVEPAARMGNIPEEWLALDNYQKGGPQALYKTLVAGRGPNGGNPGIYMKAIKAALQAASSGFDINEYKREHPSTIISDALSHVQNTIWGRCLIETQRGYLGLGPKTLEKAIHEKEDDGQDKKLLVCIIYGCSVPIILQQCQKADYSIEKEEEENEEDRVEREKKLEPFIKRWAARFHRNRIQKKRAYGLMEVSSPILHEESATEQASSFRPLDKHDYDTLKEEGALNESKQHDQARSAQDRKRPPEDLDTWTGARKKARVSAWRDPPPPSEYYKVIGESYIHNMMHGEAIKWQNDSINEGTERGMKTQIFELR